MTALVLVVLGVLAFAAPGTAERTIVTADFGEWTGYPLVKSKFAVYNSGYVPGYVRTYRRDAKLLDEVRPDSLRFDGGLGAPAGILLSSPPMISGDTPEFEYDFRQLDELTALLGEHGVRPYWCYSYVPGPLLARGRTFRNPPENLEDWAKVVAAVAGRLRDSSNPPEFHEVYNEPDNRDFFSGTIEGYLGLYDHAARAIRRADPGARIGGPSLAFTEDWIEPFLNHVTAKRLPLDFFSFHYYPGVSYSSPDVRGVIHTMRAALDRRPGLACTEMHLNEYNSLPINYPQDGPQQKHALAAMLLSDYEYFASEPCLTMVHWAQFMDTGGGNWSGMVSIDGRRKAAFNACRIYTMMPVDRRQARVDGPPGLGAMASSDEHTSSLAIWNRSKADSSVLARLKGVPFGKGTLRVFRIDSGHASWGDNPESEHLTAAETRAIDGAADLEWTGDIPAGGVVYLEARDTSGLSELASRTVARCRKVLHYYPDRTSRAYADFDRRTWIARLGMEGERTADARVAAVCEELPETLAVTMQAAGDLRKLDSRSLLGVRLDYEVRGRYIKSVLFHGGYRGGPDLFTPRRDGRLPWGTRRTADESVRVPDCSKFRLPVSEHAPPGWSGRGIVTFVLRNAGPDARVKILLARA